MAWWKGELVDADAAEVGAAGETEFEFAAPGPVVAPALSFGP